MVWDDTIIKVSETARTGRINVTQWMSHGYITGSITRQQLLYQQTAVGALYVLRQTNLKTKTQ